MYFDVGHSVVQHLNVSLDDRDLLRKTVVLADFPGQLLNFVFHHGIGTRVCDQYADQGHNTAEDGGNDAFHRRSPLPAALGFAHVHMNPAVGASQTGRVNAAATGVAQQSVRVGISPEHRGHDGRVHFVTLAKKAEMDEYALKRIVGHKIDDLTERVYTRRTVEWLISELDKIP